MELFGVWSLLIWGMTIYMCGFGGSSHCSGGAFAGDALGLFFSVPALPVTVTAARWWRRCSFLLGEY
jgi:uncharacterized protein YqgC (DUF456 family)